MFTSETNVTKDNRSFYSTSV